VRQRGSAGRDASWILGRTSHSRGSFHCDETKDSHTAQRRICCLSPLPMGLGRRVAPRHGVYPYAAVDRAFLDRELAGYEQQHEQQRAQRPQRPQRPHMATRNRILGQGSRSTRFTCFPKICVNYPPEFERRYGSPL